MDRYGKTDEGGKKAWMTSTSTEQEGEKGREAYIQAQ